VPPKPIVARSARLLPNSSGTVAVWFLVSLSPSHEQGKGEQGKGWGKGRAGEGDKLLCGRRLRSLSIGKGCALEALQSSLESCTRVPRTSVGKLQKANNRCPLVAKPLKIVRCPITTDFSTCADIRRGWVDIKTLRLNNRSVSPRTCRPCSDGLYRCHF
jgi:hypothetical protein